MNNGQSEDLNSGDLSPKSMYLSSKPYHLSEEHMPQHGLNSALSDMARVAQQ